MAVLKYTALRLLLFLAVAALLYAVGVRNLFVNAMLALLISGLVSLFVLDRARNEVSAGIERRIGDRPGLFTRINARIDAATRVWKAGKLETLIVSGDNRSRYYNEPEKMKQALIERGIPGDRIICDFAGLRTLDSVVRAKETFGAGTILFISQRFQNERAIYLAKANGIEAYGFDARDVESHAGLKTKLREVGARVKMWLDVNFLNTRPRHLGEKVEMPR